MNNRIDFYAKDTTKCIMLAELGFAGKTIAEMTDLSVGQVTYRYRKVGLSLLDYRRGSSMFAGSVIRLISHDEQKIKSLQHMIKTALKKKKYASKE